MIVLIFLFCHILTYIVSITLRLIIYKYIQKKPLGLQSILDPLILDIIRLQLAAYTFFILFLLAGLTHGQLPFLLSQVIIVMNNGANNFSYGICLFFMIIKTLLIFKRSQADVSDSTIVGGSRIFGLVVVILRFVGDFLVMQPAPAVMTKFLTGTDQQTYLRNGPFQIILVVALLLSIIFFWVTKLSVSSEEEKKVMVVALPWSFLVVIAFISFVSLQMIGKEDQVGEFMLTSLILAGIGNIFIIYFILTLPKLKTFAAAEIRKNLVFTLPNLKTLKIHKRNQVLSL